MLCDKCGKKNATVFYETFGAKGQEKMALCEECSRSALPRSEEGKQNFFSALFPMTRQDGQRACPGCGTTLEEITKAGLCGCPACYETFEEELTPTLRALHDALGHSGRMPRRIRAEKERRERLASLREELQQAVNEENYEKCPALRDAIRALTAGGDTAMEEREKVRSAS